MTQNISHSALSCTITFSGGAREASYVREASCSGPEIHSRLESFFPGLQRGGPISFFPLLIVRSFNLYVFRMKKEKRKKKVAIFGDVIFHRFLLNEQDCPEGLTALVGRRVCGTEQTPLFQMKPELPHCMKPRN